MMTREILFRGQTRKRGEKVNMLGEPIDGNWVYGGIFQGKGGHSIIYTYDPVGKFPVYSETVGQYTGLTDKNGVKIFDGDILQWDEKEWGCPHQEVVTWDYELFSMRKADWSSYCEVIGNIHDTPLPEPPKEDER